MKRLEAAGAAALEIGIPFSDPIADGAEIQRASERALGAGMDAHRALELVRRFRDGGGRVPVVVMTYLNPILRDGVHEFCREAREAGVDGVLVSDLPPDEAPEMWASFDAGGLDTVVLVAPTTLAARLPLLVARARGFVYCLARTGVTGAAGGEAAAIPERIAAIRALSELPVAVGFGISNAEQAARLRGVADAIVVGAAFMRAVGDGPEQNAPARVESLAKELIDALR
jgi:tryptophan synthase alpha chain